LSKAPPDTEQFIDISNQEVQELMYEIFSLLAEQFDGDTTLNSLRIGNYIGLKSIYYSNPTNNTDIARTLNISPSTVSRLVNNLVSMGYVAEAAHPSDGRVRLISISPDHPEQQGFENGVKQVLNNGFRFRRVEAPVEAKAPAKPEQKSGNGTRRL